MLLPSSISRNSPRTLEIEIPSRDHNKKMDGKNGQKKTRIRINNIPSEIRRKGAFLRASSTTRTTKRRSGNKTRGRERRRRRTGKVETRVTRRGTKLHRSKNKKKRYDTANNNIQYFIRSSPFLSPLLLFTFPSWTRVHETGKKKRKRSGDRSW